MAKVDKKKMEKFEKSKKDAKADKKHGAPEGSKKDKAQDERDVKKMKRGGCA